MPRGIPSQMLGKRYGAWTVLERAGKDKGGHILWVCRCDCGREAVVQGGNLRSGRSASCQSCGNRKAAQQQHARKNAPPPVQ